MFFVTIAAKSQQAEIVIFKDFDGSISVKITDPYIEELNYVAEGGEAVLLCQWFLCEEGFKITTQANARAEVDASIPSEAIDGVFFFLFIYLKPEGEQDFYLVKNPSGWDAVETPVGEILTVFLGTSAEPLLPSDLGKTAACVSVTEKVGLTVSLCK
jgi:hypothetical protein